MVSHASRHSDSSFHPQPSNEENSLADQVLAKLQDESLTSAFNFMKASVKNVYNGRDEDQDGVIDVRDKRDDVPMNDKEKGEFWNSLAKELEEKKPGVLKNLSAVWMKDFKTNDLKGETFQADFVRQVASNDHLMNGTLAKAALGDLQNVKNLHTVDNVIDDIELDKNIIRQRMVPRDQFVKDVLSQAAIAAQTSPGAALEGMKQALSTRSYGETQAERHETAEALKKALKENPELNEKIENKPKQISREHFVHSVIQSALVDSETSPVKAVDAIYKALKERRETVSQEENMASFQAIADELKNHPDLAAKLAMGYMHRNFKDIDTNNDHQRQDYKISREELNDFNPDSVGKAFLSYVKTNFDSIATTSIYNNSYRNADFLTQDEVANHLNRLKRKK
jgi:uncharacterized protein (DUF2267 family)